jgi:modulator of FtsH protease
MNFYVATAGAAAALTGLVFVGLSINLSRVLEIPGMVARSGESILLLGLALLVSLQSLIPGQSLVRLGWEIGPVSLGAWFLPVIVQWRWYRKRHYRRYMHVLVRIALHQSSTLPTVIAAVLLMNQHAYARYWLADGILLTLVAGMISAWVLMVEIVR